MKKSSLTNTQLVTLHGGKIDFSSKEGSWTKFAVQIPFVNVAENEIIQI